jgi:hypothetical protein
MPATPKGFPYPTPDDPVSLGANDIRALAEASDALSFWINVGGIAVKTGGAAQAGTYVAANVGTPGEVRLGSPAAGITLGLDANLYRHPSAPILCSDTQIWANLGTNQVGIGTMGPTGQAGVSFSAAADVTLYRPEAGVLMTGGHLRVGGVVDVFSTAGIRFGAAFDTSLYREAANVLKTNGMFRVGGAGVGAEQSGLELYIDGAWRRVSRRSDGVMIC